MKCFEQSKEFVDIDGALNQISKSLDDMTGAILEERWKDVTSSAKLIANISERLRKLQK